jgi:glycosyltransferase involved in cell wall biosynthesis
MRIFFTGNSAWGMQKFRGPLINDYLNRGFDATVVAPDDGYAESIQNAGCAFIPFKMSRRGLNPFGDILTFLQLLGIYRLNKPDFVIHYTVKPNIWGSLAANILGIPNIAVVTGLGYAFMKESLILKIVSRLYKTALSRTREVWFLNSDDMEEFKRRHIVPAGKMRIIPGEGLDLSRFAFSSTFPETPVFLLVARMLRDKGIIEFVEAARIAKKEAPRIRFQLLGPVDNGNPSAIPKSQLDAWHSEGVIEYLGSTDDVRPLMSAATCVVLPSYREGIPLTLLEGAAMGRPLIASDCPGCRDVVREGFNGMLVSARNSQALYDAIVRMARMENSELKTLGLNGRGMIEKIYSMDAILAIYRQNTASGSINDAQATNTDQ